MQSALDRWGVDPRFLKIEITESSIMADPAHALAILSMLQSMGVRLSVDDFGTGYSSLTHLRELPIDEIKIDKSFVMGMTQQRRRRRDRPHRDRPRATTSASRCAPRGWRTRRRGGCSRELGCDLAQGYWIARPMPANELMRWLVGHVVGDEEAEGASVDLRLHLDLRRSRFSIRFAAPR